MDQLQSQTPFLRNNALYGGTSLAYLICISVIWDISLGYIMHFLSISQAYLRHISGLSQGDLQNIWSISSRYLINIKTISGISQGYIMHILSIYILGIYQAYISYISVSSQVISGNLQNISCKYSIYLKNISGISWKYISHITSQAYLRHISDTLRGTLCFFHSKNDQAYYCLIHFYKRSRSTRLWQWFWYPNYPTTRFDLSWAMPHSEKQKRKTKKRRTKNIQKGQTK